MSETKMSGKLVLMLPLPPLTRAQGNPRTQGVLGTRTPVPGPPCPTPPVPAPRLVCQALVENDGLVWEQTSPGESQQGYPGV